MKGLLATALLLAGLVSSANAQQAFGPIDITNNVNGVPVTVRVTSWLTVGTGDDDGTVNIRMFADLIDLQRKFADVAGTFTPAANVCANRRGGRQSPVTTLKRASLAPRGNQLVMSMRGHIDVWSCFVGKRKFALRWRKKHVAFLHVKLPAIHSWRPVTKKKDGSQRFRGSLPIYLVQRRHAIVSLETAKPDITLVGPKGVVSGGTLRIAKAIMRRRVYDALQRAIDPAKLRKALPAKIWNLNLSAVSARFMALGGHAIAEINLEGPVPDGFSTTLRQVIAARSAE